MVRSKLGAVRRAQLLASVLTLLAVPLSAQIVEKGRTFADLTASHPCDTGLTDRIARVTDCDAAGTIGDGGGAFQCWAYCDGSAPWADVAIDGGGGGAATAVEGSATLPATCTEKDLYQDTDSGGTEFYVCTSANVWTKTGTGAGDVVGPASSTDNAIARFDSTTGKLLQGGSFINVLDATGSTASNIKNVNGTTTFQNDALNPGFIDVGSQSWRDASANRVGIFYSGHFSVASDHRIGFADSTTEANNVDTSLVRSAAGIVGFTNATTGGGAIHLTPMASPPRTCDATAEGDIYSDTSHALCWCDASTWQKLSGAGTCA